MSALSDYLSNKEGVRKDTRKEGSSKIHIVIGGVGSEKEALVKVILDTESKISKDLLTKKNFNNLLATLAAQVSQLNDEKKISFTDKKGVKEKKKIIGVYYAPSMR